MSALPLRLEQQRTLFLVVSGISTAGSFAGITAKGWILLHGSADPFVLALNFAALSLPSLIVSGPAGVRTDRLGCERVLVQAQWALLAAAALGALAIPLLEGQAQVLLLLGSTLLVGIAGAFELTARNKYCSLLVEEPQQLAGYLASFSVVFNVGKLVGPPIGGWLVAFAGPAWALGIDATSYLLPIASVMFLLQPRRDLEQRSDGKAGATLIKAWRDCGSTLRGVLTLTAVLCVVNFFHPGLAPLIAEQVLGPDPRDLGLFTSVLAAGSIAGGVVLQRNSTRLTSRPFLTLGGFALITAIAQLGMARTSTVGISLAMTFLIGAGTAGLLSSCNLITQIGAPQVMRGRMAGLSQIAFLGGGGLSGLLAALMVMATSLSNTFAITGGVGAVLALMWIVRRGGQRLEPLRST
ncbi:MAG: MFS transporter [Synechococcus sp. MED650]|nr:MFS transporter [Synechococcus sp. MED650]OUW54824.1 MAG: MFS transporter [Cyanobacteria bacterium TMED188]